MEPPGKIPGDGHPHDDLVSKVFEDFREGDIIETPRRTLDLVDIISFAELTRDLNPIHMDEDHARLSSFGSRIAHGPLIFSLANGLVAQTDFLGDAATAFVGLDRLRLSRPVRPGDTIHVIAIISKLEHCRRPEIGRACIEYSVVNQHQEAVMTFVQTVLLRRADPPN